MTALVVAWRVTTHCNLGCAFCGFDRGLVRPRAETGAAVVERFGEALGAWTRASGRAAHVSWLGGEPLLWPPLARVSGAYRQHGGITLGVTTNGTLLVRPAMRALLLEHFADVTVSVDGLAAFHDRVRGDAGLFCALGDVVRSLAREKRAAGTGPLLRANVVLMRGNVEAFPDLIRELARWGIEEITVNQLGGNDRPEFFPDNRLLSGQARRLADEWPRLCGSAAALGVRLRGTSQYLRRITASASDERIAPEDCAPGRSFLFIDEAGRVSPCSFTSREYGVDVARLDSPAAIDALPERFDSARRQARAHACADCHSTQVFGKWEMP